ncbi:MAG: response regulator [Bryobacteraceae bacterium]|jgi:CheY-like chemotaxis protein
MMLSGGTILIVEDDPALCALAQEVLSSAGYSVLAAQDGAYALRVAEEYSGQIQLLLTDITLPDLGGQEIAARIQARRPETKVIFMSGHARVGINEKESLDPQTNFLQKPWTPRGLCEKIVTVLTTQPPAQRILVVDDEPDVRDWLVEILEGCGHRVFTAKDGLEAKQLAAREALDVLITDISMPNEEGLGVIRALRKTYPGLKIIAMSGSHAEVLMDAKLLGANAALTKPFTSEMVLKCIRGLVTPQTPGAPGRAM